MGRGSNGSAKAPGKTYAPRLSPGQAASKRFEKALEEMIEAALGIKDFVMAGNEKEELEDLRAFKAKVEQVMKIR